MDWALLSRMLGVGWLLLLWAILFNLVFLKTGLFSWYDFLENIGKKITFFNYIILFLAYPFVLGVGVFLILKLIPL